MFPTSRKPAASQSKVKEADFNLVPAAVDLKGSLFAKSTVSDVGAYESTNAWKSKLNQLSKWRSTHVNTCSLVFSHCHGFYGVIGSEAEH